MLLPAVRSRRAPRKVRHVRYSRNHGCFGRAGDRSRSPFSPQRNAASSRAGRGRAALRAWRGSRPSPAVHHRSLDGTTAALQRGPKCGRRLQRRDLQLSGADPRARGARSRLPHEERYRGDRPRLGAMGRGLRHALSRNVRVRAVGPQSRNAVPRARPAGREAAALRAAAERAPGLRIRAEVAGRAPGVRARVRSVRDRRVFRAGLRARAADHLRGRAQAAAGAHADDPSRPADARATRILGCPVHARQSISERDARSGTGGAPARIGPAADDRRGSARRVSVRRRGFERRRRDDGRRQLGSGQHVLDRVRRSGVRRVEVREAGRRPLPHAPFRRHGRERRFRSHRRARPDLRRAVRGQFRAADLSRLPAGEKARDRRVVRRRRRRELRRISPLPAARDGRAPPERDAAFGPASGVRNARTRVSEGRLGAAGIPRQVDVPGAGADLGRCVLSQRVDPA